MEGQGRGFRISGKANSGGHTCVLVSAASATDTESQIALGSGSVFRTRTLHSQGALHSQGNEAKTPQEAIG